MYEFLFNESKDNWIASEQDNIVEVGIIYGYGRACVAEQKIVYTVILL